MNDFEFNTKVKLKDKNRNGQESAEQGRSFNSGIFIDR